MKKRIAVTMSLLLSLGMLVGCGEDNSKQPATESGMIEQTEYEFQDEYYMLSTTPFEVDTEAMISYLIPDYEKNASNVAVETEYINEEAMPSDTRYSYALTIGERYYDWELSKIDSSFLVWATKLTSEADYHGGVPVEDIIAADRLADDLLAEIGIETVLSSKEEYPLPSGAGNTLTYLFCQSYEGVEIADGFFDIGAQNLEGPFIHVEIDGSGLRMVAFHGLVTVGDILKTYQSSEFLSIQELEKRAIAYDVHFMFNVGVDEVPDVQTDIKDVEIVYIPNIEKGQKVLIPAYKLIMAETWNDEEGMIGKYSYIMDVFTGYVYDRMMISE